MGGKSGCWKLVFRDRLSCWGRRWWFYPSGQEPFSALFVIIGFVIIKSSSPQFCGDPDNISLTLLKGFRIGLLILLQGGRLMGLWTNKQFNKLQRYWSRLCYGNDRESVIRPGVTALRARHLYVSGDVAQYSNFFFVYILCFFIQHHGLTPHLQAQSS
jgi:hypothetical protein